MILLTIVLDTEEELPTGSVSTQERPKEVVRFLWNQQNHDYSPEEFCFWCIGKGYKAKYQKIDKEPVLTDREKIMANRLLHEWLKERKWLQE